MGILQSIAAKVSPTTKAVGDSGEALALNFLLSQGLMLVARNFKTPGRGGGEVDLIMRESVGTLVFVEVRQRKSARHGGAAASVSLSKQRRIIFAAQHFISRLARTPPCRFDVIAIQGEAQGEGEGEGERKGAQIEWLRAAFDAS